MAFMFKGPAALTGASTITANTVTTTGAVSLGSTLGVTGAVTTTAGVTVGNALTVSGGGAAITGNSAITGTLSVSQAITATGGITMAGATVTSIERGTSPDASSDIIASKKYVAEQVAGGGGAAGASTISNGGGESLAPNTTYFINADSAVASTITQGSLVNGSLVRFVIISGSANVVLTYNHQFQPMSGSSGTTLTLSGVGHSAQFVFYTGGKLHAVSGGGTIA
jgi:hypothetical protein